MFVTHHIKIGVTFFVLSFFISCGLTQNIQTVEPNLNTVLNTSIFSSNVYIGISPRMRTHEKEIAYAKLHIARQIAIRASCIVDVGTLHIAEGRDDFFLYDYGFDYDDTYIDEIMNRIEIIDEYQFKELVVVVGKDSRSQAAQNVLIPRQAEKRPQWVHDILGTRNLLGNGYLVGVGVADKYSQLYKGIYTADIGAAQAIASENETHVNTYALDKVTSRTKYFASGILTMTENIELDGFYILDRWIEPDGSKYYSLGIAHSRKTIQGAME